MARKKRVPRRKSERLIHEVRKSFQEIRSASARFHCYSFTKATGLEMNDGQKEALQAADSKIDEAWAEAQAIFSEIIGDRVIREIVAGEWN
jgi:hypothetical protein